MPKKNTNLVLCGQNMALFPILGERDCGVRTVLKRGHLREHCLAHSEEEPGVRCQMSDAVMCASLGRWLPVQCQLIVSRESCPGVCSSLLALSWDRRRTKVCDDGSRRPCQCRHLLSVGIAVSPTRLMGGSCSKVSNEPKV